MAVFLAAQYMELGEWISINAYQCFFKYVSVSRSIQHIAKPISCPELPHCASASRELQALRPARIHETRPCWWPIQNLGLYVH